MPIGQANFKDRWQKLAVAKRLLTETDLRAAQESHKDVADVLIERGRLTEEQIAQLKAEVAGLVYIDVLDYQIDPKVLELVPETVARKHTLLPLYRVGSALTIAVDNPWNTIAIDEVRLSAKLPVVQPVLSTTSAIRKAISHHYGHKVVEEAAKRPTNHTQTKPSSAPVSAIELPEPRRTNAPEAASEVPVAKLVDALLTEALEARASDIHVEPDEEHTRVRYRIDGVLHEIKVLPPELHESIASRVKLLANLDITEHRLPQDGHIPLTVDGQLIDLRISTYPTVFGENVVIRLLDHGSLHLKLDELGFAQDVMAQFEQLVQRPYGMILATGPTGSGKTTSLYAALAQINSMTKNIMTIEDPVEYRLPLIRQTQLNLKAGVTFAAGLRSLLRQDPDIIMVGEIRDQETAEVAIHAALTGHLVFSTLHTNDSVAAIARLVDMGLEPYLLASTLLGIIAQRLVRRICSHCKEQVAPSAAIRQRYPELSVIYRGKGCRYCLKTGFLGRMGVFELLRIDEEAQGWIAAKAPSDEMKRQAIARGMRTMRADGLLKVKEGLTTLEEIDHVVPADL